MGKPYKFKLNEDIMLTQFVPNHFSLMNGTYSIYFEEKLMGQIIVLRGDKYHHTVLTLKIFAGYSWDGCTPKIKIGTNIIGIWDGFTDSETLLPKAYKASLWHDFLLQFKSQLPKGFGYNFIHLVFLNQLLKDGFTFSYLYYLVVCIWTPISKVIKWFTK